MTRAMGHREPALILLRARMSQVSIITCHGASGTLVPTDEHMCTKGPGVHYVTQRMQSTGLKHLELVDYF